jgi:hypothetical protein
VIACIGVSWINGAVAAPAILASFIFVYSALRWKEQRNEAEFQLQKAQRRIERQRNMVAGGGVSLFAWNWPQRLPDKDSDNLGQNLQSGANLMAMQTAKEG